MKQVIKTRQKPLTGIGRSGTGLPSVWLFVLLLLLVAGGCTQTDVEENVIPPHALKDVDASFNLNVLASQPPVTRSVTFTPDGTIESDTLTVGVNDSVQTRASSSLTNEEENRIASLWVGQYDAATGTRLFSQYIASMSGNTVNLKLKQSANGSNSHVYFIPNAGDLGEIANEETLKKHTLPYASTDAGLPDGNLCKMFGIWSGPVSENGVRDISVDLTRLLAKITFTYSIGSDFQFTPSVVQLKNAPSLSQVEAPKAQLTTDNRYKTYAGTASPSGATVYWYLPENMAGIVSGDNAVESDKQKTGKGVMNATCIELTGDAVQGGVTYRDVTFRFYPGSDMNNYNILRNAHYMMTVTLVGIDVSDERISVGTIPDIEVTGENMPAKKGGEKEVQITARPGQPWVFEMPSWLSAVLDSKEIKPGATIAHQGPAKVVFKAVEANPRAESRDTTFTIKVGEKDQTITIVQDGATLTKGGDISLDAAVNSEGSSTFTATEGLQWSAVLNDGDGWLGWSATNPGTSGNEAPAGAQALNVKATTSNPSAQTRSGKIVVKAGASRGDDTYDKLKQEITITQAGSTVTGSTQTVAAVAANDLTSTFTATPGLDWTASVINGSWITLNTTSGGPTTGSTEDISYNVAVNPTSSIRKDAITVQAGNAEDGPTGTITVTQAAASLTANVNKANLAAITDDSGTLTYQATAGLPFLITAPDWLNLTGEVSGTTTDGEKTIEYKSKLNLDSVENKGNISVTAGEMVKDVLVTQAGSVFEVSPTILELGKTETSGTITITGTTGLPWTITRQDGTEEISSNSDGGILSNGSNTLAFSATENTGGSRSAKFTIAVEGGYHSKTVEIKQAAAVTGISVRIDQSVLTSYKTIPPDMKAYPPFNADGMNNYHGCNVNETAGTMSGYYTIEIEKGQRPGTATYNVLKEYCTELDKDGRGWRLPTQIELHAMYINRAKIEGSTDASQFVLDYFYISNTIYNGSSAICRLAFKNGGFSYSTRTYPDNTVRCVRDI